MRKIILGSLLCAAGVYSAAQGVDTAAWRKSGEIDWKASGNLPPGAEYHLIYEDAKTHAVQTLVRMPNGYALPAHSHSYDETMLVIKGKLILDFGDRRRTLGPCCRSHRQACDHEEYPHT